MPLCDVFFPDTLLLPVHYRHGCHRCGRKLHHYVRKYFLTGVGRLVIVLRFGPACLLLGTVSTPLVFRVERVSQ